MTWRVHLTNRALMRLDILENEKSAVLAAWTHPGRVSYFDLHSGIPLGETQLSGLNSRDHEHWQTLLPTLEAPNGLQLHIIPTTNGTLYLGETAEIRLHYLPLGETVLAVGEREIKFDRPFVAAALDHESGLMAALDRDGCLHLYDKASATGEFDIGLPSPAPRTPVMLNVRESRVLVAYGRHLIEVDSAGKIVKRLELHYPISALASSAAGHLLACCDRETNVIRIYEGEKLTPRYQRHAEDLMVKATQVQLLADPPPSMAALNSLAVNEQGMLAFALAGVICVAGTEQMNLVPQP